MSAGLAQVVAWLNAVANALGKVALAPLAMAPGWLSATGVAVASGFVMLLVFKHTSHQRAIKRVRDGIKADLLTLKLFKDSARVALRAQGHILIGACWLLLLAMMPMSVMIVPVLLLMSQLSLWYDARPLRVGEETVITLKLNGPADSPWPEVYLRPTEAAEIMIGPVRVRSKREICWNIKALQSGYHRLVFHVDGQPIDKELAIGNGFMRISRLRPPGNSWDTLWHPEETPFAASAPVQSIAIDYPERSSWTSGTFWWPIYWLAASMAAAFAFRRPLNVNL